MNCNNGNTSREIIIRLIDSHKINGTEAYTLIRDLVKNEPYITYTTNIPSSLTTTTGAPYDYSYSVSSNKADYLSYK